MEREDIRKKVAVYFDTNIQYVHQTGLFISEETRDHIINIATSIYCTKHGIGYPGGSFVQAVVDNDLMKTFSTADDINSRVIKFYVVFLYNFSPY
jgi:hypothetical protein